MTSGPWGAGDGVALGRLFARNQGGNEQTGSNSNGQKTNGKQAPGRWAGTLRAMGCLSERFDGSKLAGHVITQREPTSGFQKMDPVFDGDADNMLHIGSPGRRKFLRATREKRFEPHRACLNGHPARGVTGIRESMN